METEYFFNRNGRIISEEQWYWNQTDKAEDAYSKANSAECSKDFAAITTPLGYALLTIDKAIKSATRRVCDTATGEDVVEGLNKSIEAYTE